MERTTILTGSGFSTTPILTALESFGHVNLTHNRMRGYGGPGQAGDFGSPGRSGAKALNQAEILTDTMGVDFGPYLTRIVQIVKQNWYNLMPPSVYPPILKQGKLAIEFVIDRKSTR